MSRGGKLPRISKIPTSYYREVSTDRREYVAVQNPGKAERRVVREVREEKHEKRGHGRDPLSTSRLPLQRKQQTTKETSSKFATKKILPKPRDGRLPIKLPSKPMQKIQPQNQIKIKTINDLLEFLIKKASHIRASRLPNKERVGNLLQLIKNVENEIQKLYPDLAQVATVAVARPRSPNTNMQRIVDELADLSHQLQDESMPEFSSYNEEKEVIPDGQSETSYLSFVDMNTDDLFKDAMDHFDGEKINLEEIEDHLSLIDEESSPELVSTIHESFSEHFSDLMKETFPDLSSTIKESKDQSFLNSAEMNTDFGEVMESQKKHPMERRIPIEISDQFSAIDDESSPELVQDLSRSKERPSFTSASDLQNESFPTGATSLESTPGIDSSGRSTLQSHEMNVEDLFTSNIQSKAKKDFSKIYDNLSDIGKESVPEFSSLGPEEASSSKSWEESFPRYSIFKRPLIKEKEKIFPGISSSLKESRVDESILKSHEMNIEDLFQNLTGHSQTPSRLKYIREKYLGQSEDQSQIADESAPNLTAGSAFGRDSASGYDQSILTSKDMQSGGLFGSILEELPPSVQGRAKERKDLTGSDLNEESSPALVSASGNISKDLSKQGSHYFKSYLTNRSDLAKESFPDLSASMDERSTSSSKRDPSFLQSHEMHTDDLFKSALEDVKEASPSYGASSSKELDKESFPHINSSYLEEVQSSKGDLSVLQSHEMMTDDLFKSSLADAKEPSSAKVYEDSAKELDKESFPNITPSDLEQSMRSSNHLTVKDHSRDLDKELRNVNMQNVVQLQAQELKKTKERFFKFIDNMGSIIRMLKSSYEKDPSNESIRQIYGKLEGEMASFIQNEKQ